MALQHTLDTARGILIPHVEARLNTVTSPLPDSKSATKGNQFGPLACEALYYALPRLDDRNHLHRYSRRRFQDLSAAIRKSRELGHIDHGHGRRFVRLHWGSRLCAVHFEDERRKAATPLETPCCIDSTLYTAARPRVCSASFGQGTGLR